MATKTPKKSKVSSKSKTTVKAKKNAQPKENAEPVRADSPRKGRTTPKSKPTIRSTREPITVGDTKSRGTKTNTTVVTRGKYYGMHKAQVSKYVKLPISKLRTGMILEVVYHADYRIAPKTSLYVVIEPKYQGYIHVIDLDYISPSTLSKFTRFTQGRKMSTVKIGSSEYPYFDFKSSGKALYSLLEPVMDSAYRKLARSGNNLRSIRIAQYELLVPEEEDEA